MRAPIVGEPAAARSCCKRALVDHCRRFWLAEPLEEVALLQQSQQVARLESERLVERFGFRSAVAESTAHGCEVGPQHLRIGITGQSALKELSGASSVARAKQVAASRIENDRLLRGTNQGHLDELQGLHWRLVPGNLVDGVCEGSGFGFADRCCAHDTVRRWHLLAAKFTRSRRLPGVYDQMRRIPRRCTFAVRWEVVRSWGAQNCTHTSRQARRRAGCLPMVVAPRVPRPGRAIRSR